MFLACSSPKEPDTPVAENDSAVSFTDDTYVNIVNCDYIITTNLCRLQEEYQPTDDTTLTEEEEQGEGILRKEKKFIVFECCLIKLLEQCCIVVVKRLS